MNYTVVIGRTAQKQLANISKPFLEAIQQKIQSLETNPWPPGCKKLNGREGWRIRSGDYRIIYDVIDEILQVTVIEVGNRKNIYQKR